MTIALSAPTNTWLARGRHVRAGEHQLFTVEVGKGPVLVLLHGFPTSAYDYRGMLDRLSDRFRCIACDFPGYGLSSKPIAYSYSLFQQADAVEALLRELGVTSARVVCHDMSTSIVCELLARQLESRLGFRLESATITNGSMLQWRASITPFQKLLAANETLPQAMAISERIGDSYVRGLQALMKRPEVVSAEDAIAMRELLLHADGHLRLPALAGYMRERYVHRDRWISALTQSQALLTLVWGMEDPIANLEMGRELHELLPKSPYIELDGVGHFVIFEDPERVAAAVANSKHDTP